MFLFVFVYRIFLFQLNILCKLLSMNSCSQCSRKTDCVNCHIRRKLVHTVYSGLSRLEGDCIRSNSRKIHYYTAKSATLLIKLNLIWKLWKSNWVNWKTLKPDGSNRNPSTDDIIDEIEDRNRLYSVKIKHRVKKTAFAGDNSVSSSLSCSRLGKFNDSKNLPLRLVFATPQHALDAVKAYRQKKIAYT